ncbi:hypothetical protein PHYSODRAFT_339229 [Phytophthora sojae]|uniref:Uncharacterized protein n=1 Tax=Phytophthora sojae (strain P6497) TaxID=1094619 RepID=G5A641_PHYSP|nr:hypothetical protein PHYSODRAFT_339229 [Phytophthora sojae]EGZ08796.1 hypothetical protein PHYSODRAFT_339229 [Phytophthora sojae]|eukprot:XP_009535429.1 hypothetical protein PHYSODRAFT_339229 [Phytophthora sojae]
MAPGPRSRPGREGRVVAIDAEVTLTRAPLADTLSLELGDDAGSGEDPGTLATWRSGLGAGGGAVARREARRNPPPDDRSPETTVEAPSTLGGTTVQADPGDKSVDEVTGSRIPVGDEGEARDAGTGAAVTEATAPEPPGSKLADRHPQESSDAETPREQVHSDPAPLERGVCLRDCCGDSVLEAMSAAKWMYQRHAVNLEVATGGRYRHVQQIPCCPRLVVSRPHDFYPETVRSISAPTDTNGAVVA